MAFKSYLMRNFLLRSPTIKLGSTESRSQPRGSKFTDISNSKLVEGLRFGRWFLGRTGEGRKTSSDLVLQCHSVAALRVRRIVKILQLYKEIYSEHAVVKFFQSYSASFKSVLNGKTILGVRSSAGTLLGACLFHWNEESISESDLRICIDDLKQLERIKTALQGSGEDGGRGGGGREDGRSGEEDVNSDSGVAHSQVANGNHGNSHNSTCSSENGKNSTDNRIAGDGLDSHGVPPAAGDNFLEGWEPVMDQPRIKVWRRPIFDGELYQYKVYGTWDDVPAAAFYLIQVDLDYRKAWDKLVVNLDVIDRDVESGAEVVHWVTHFPFPMSQRDYVYARRFMVDRDNNIAVLMSKGVEHPKEPVRRKFVRVHRYMSNMVIKPHGRFEEAGLDYVLTYYDDPQATIPSVAMSWMASTGVPKFTEDLRSATLNLVKEKGMPIVEDMFQRRINDQPLATLKDSVSQTVIEEEVEELLASQDNESVKWAAIFDVSNNGEEPRLEASDLALQPLNLDVASQPLAAVNTPDREEEKDPSKGIHTSEAQCNRTSTKTTPPPPPTTTNIPAMLSAQVRQRH